MDEGGNWLIAEIVTLCFCRGAFATEQWGEATEESGAEFVGWTVGGRNSHSSQSDR